MPTADYIFTCRQASSAPSYYNPDPNGYGMVLLLVPLEPLSIPLKLMGSSCKHTSFAAWVFTKTIFLGRN